MQYSFHICTGEHIPKAELQRFYKRNGHKGRIQTNDICAWLTDDQSTIAAVRLSPSLPADGEYLLLKGLWVLRKSRSQGIGSLLLRELSSYLFEKQKACYCFAYQHLETFYHSHKFEPVTQETSPVYLWQRYIRYLDRGQQFKLMRLSPTTSTT